MTIGEQIKKIRKEKGLSQKELGKLLGVSQQMIGQYESPNSNLKLDTIKKISSVLKIDYNELIKKDILGVAEYVNAGAATGLDLFRTFIELDIIPYKPDRKKDVLNMIDSAIEKGVDIEDRGTYYYNLEVELSHMILNDLLEPYKEADITDIAELVAYFLKLTESGQAKVLEYEDDLFGNDIYLNKSLPEDNT